MSRWSTRVFIFLIRRHAWNCEPPSYTKLNTINQHHWHDNSQGKYAVGFFPHAPSPAGGPALDGPEADRGHGGEKEAAAPAEYTPPAPAEYPVAEKTKKADGGGRRSSQGTGEEAGGLTRRWTFKGTIIKIEARIKKKIIQESDRECFFLLGSIFLLLCEILQIFLLSKN